METVTVECLDSHPWVDDEEINNNKTNKQKTSNFIMNVFCV